MSSTMKASIAGTDELIANNKQTHAQRLTRVMCINLIYYRKTSVTSYINRMMSLYSARPINPNKRTNPICCPNNCTDSGTGLRMPNSNR